ncbi:KIF20 [Lepeophtheirus salmonis]|uniref:KIF20 n=1 Tax=Lepeophtheirus salmonis TaxID=72036 RepID=A0A7R8CPD1_LEPSM|nr:KIF20 [Lepeophtheirus salmonis]CAF2885033.1 KIF20 [Lepeophtheirus salmonis]
MSSTSKYKPSFFTSSLDGDFRYKYTSTMVPNSQAHSFRKNCRNGDVKVECNGQPERARIKKTRNVGSRRVEAGNINASFLVLGRVMRTLRDTQRIKDVTKHAIAPFKDSKLTRLFQTLFARFEKTSMIVYFSQPSYLFDVTLQVLKFTAISSKISYA